MGPSRPHGFSITETLVAAVIFAVTAAGIFATIGGLKKPGVKTNRSLEAAYIGQQVLEGMRNNVDAGKWNDPGDALYGTAAGTAHNCNPQTIVKDGVTYQCTYTVTQDTNSGARKVVVNVTWPDGS